ncbi:MAG: hypothetical protein LBN38_03340 [Verrucomicrobiota bacterium]|nr:hypothetical protein [Verrucomicrobiota bacterium]
MSKPETTSSLKQSVDRELPPSLMSSIGGVPLSKAWVSLLVFYLLALALNGVPLHRNNEHLPYGRERSFWVALSTPVARFCEALKLDRPRTLLQETAGAALNNE